MKASGDIPKPKGKGRNAKAQQFLNFEERNRMFLLQKEQRLERLKEQNKNSFKPKINEKSKKLNEQIFGQQQSVPRYLNLYELKDVLQQRENERMEIALEEKRL